ncbi:MAG: Maf family protein [Acidiferrobacterales bacterium]
MSQLYLASGSPRRAELLRQLGIDFEVVVPDVQELPRSGESPEHYVRRMAATKAQRVWRTIHQEGSPVYPVLGADTCVVLDEEILSKPRDQSESAGMLRRLSGREHVVLTAVTVVDTATTRSALSTSRVAFRSLTEREIGRYWRTGEPADKAGAYALQGLGAAFVKKIDGSYSGVVGLPLHEVAQLLNEIGMEVL